MSKPQSLTSIPYTLNFHNPKSHGNVPFMQERKYLSPLAKMGIATLGTAGIACAVTFVSHAYQLHQLYELSPQMALIIPALSSVAFTYGLDKFNRLTVPNPALNLELVRTQEELTQKELMNVPARMKQLAQKKMAAPQRNPK